MMQSLVLTVLSDDRPGVVDELSAVIAAHKGVWVESRMASLAGKFAGLLRVRAPSAQVEALGAALAALESRGLHVQLEVADGARQPVADAHSLRIELVGPDRPGIVHQIAHALAERGISVDELTTEVSDASMAGGELFRASAVLQLPAGISSEALEEQLDALGNELTLDIEVEVLDDD